MTADILADYRIHKAVPGPTDEQYCAICGHRIKSVPGGDGPTWVHSDSGAVVALNPPNVKSENLGRNVDKPLNEIMEFDHVIRVHRDGQITTANDVSAPEGWYDGELSQGVNGPWQLMTGYSGQDHYDGPCMHNSEFIGGGMELDIRSTPGVYVALICQYTSATDPDDDHDYEASNYDEGWVVAYIHDEN